MDSMKIAIAAMLVVTPVLAQQAPSTVTQMPFASTPFNGTELIYMVQQGNSRKTNVSTLAAQFQSFGLTGFLYGNGFGSPITSVLPGTGVSTALTQPVTGSGGIALATGASLVSPTVTGAGTYSSLTAAVSGNTTYLAAVNQFPGRLVVATGATSNGVVGAAIQDGSSGNSFPTGVTGYGYLNSAGNASFGGFFRDDCYTAGNCIGAEANTFNYTTAATATFPGNEAFGTSETYAVGVQVVAYGTAISKTGLYIASGLAGYGFQAGIYLNPLAANQYGILVDANSTVSAANAATFNTVGAAGNVNLTLNTMTAPNASAYFIKAVANGTGVLTVAGNGQTAIYDLSTSDTAALTVSATSDTGGVNINLQGNGGTTPGKTIRVVGGVFQILNNAYTTAILGLTDAGVLSLPGTSTGTPAASLCLDASNNVIKKTTAGSCV